MALTPASAPRALTASARRRNDSARSFGAQLDQPDGSSNAVRAALTTASMSAACPAAALPISCPELADRTDIVESLDGAIHRPPMNSASPVPAMS